MLGRLLEEPALGAEAGVRPDDVDAPEMRERRRDDGLLLGEVRDVALHRERAIGAAELLGERVELVLRTGREHEPVAGLRGPAGGGGADPARRSGDEEDGIWHAAS